MDNDSKILVAGSNGMVGSAIVRNLHDRGYKNIIEASRKDVDFTNQSNTAYYFDKVKPDYVFVAAAKVGGIHANRQFKGDFIYENLMIQTNIIHNSYMSGVRKLLFLGSSCIYPKYSPQPITEDQLLCGELEPTNDAYSVAKIAGIQMCKAYREQHGFNSISLMPTNLYGPNDNFDPETSHVIPAMINKFYVGKKHSEYYNIKLWGDGSPKREFLHVDDLAEACHTCMKKYNDPDIINVGTGEDITIRELAETIKSISGFNGEIIWNDKMPNGTQRKVLDVSKIKSLGWEPKISLRKGIKDTYDYYVLSQNKKEIISSILK